MQGSDRRLLRMLKTQNRINSMKIELWWVGNTAERYLKEGMEVYKKRIKHYLPFEVTTIADVKNAAKMSENQLKEKEGELIFKRLKQGDRLILLDERGKTYTSLKFAAHNEKILQYSHHRIVFLIGGAYGFSDAIYKRADERWSLSSMTFSHQMVRLFTLEQIYRALTILNNQPYHHE